MDRKQRILVFASGTKTGGGSGFEKLVEATRGDDPVLNATIVGVVTNHSEGGVAQRAARLGIPCYLLTEFTAEEYRQVIGLAGGADWFMLSGWLKKVVGFPMARTVNIHPGPLPLTQGLHGSQVHQRMMEAYRRGAVTHSAVTMHFVDDEYDTGPVAFSVDVTILDDDTPDTLGKRVNACEHVWQPRVLDDIVHGRIWLDGRTVRHAEGYSLCAD